MLVIKGEKPIRLELVFTFHIKVILYFSKIFNTWCHICLSFITYVNIGSNMEETIIYDWFSKGNFFLPKILLQ